MKPRYPNPCPHCVFLCVVPGGDDFYWCKQHCTPDNHQLSEPCMVSLCSRGCTHHISPADDLRHDTFFRNHRGSSSVSLAAKRRLLDKSLADEILFRQVETHGEA